MRVHLWLPALLLTGAAAAAPAVAEPPQPVSPGSLTELAATVSRCPTFTWTTAAEAAGYELAAYLAEDGEAAAGSADAPVLHEHLPAGAGSWTPPADACLERGSRYAWSIRAETVGGATEWSPPALFEVAPLPADVETEELVRLVLERLDEAGGAGPQTTERQAHAEEPLFLRHRPEAAPRPGAPVRPPRRAPGSAGGAAPDLAARQGIEAQAGEPVQLSVDGAVQAARFAFERPRRVDLLVGAPSFRVASTSEDDDWAINSGGYGFVPSIPDSAASVSLMAPVHGLPNGAVIQEFSCRFAQLQSSPTATFVFDLRRRDDFDFTPEGVAGLSGATFETGSTVAGRAALSIEEPEVRDDFEYFITGRWDPTAVGSQIRFYGCVVSYEIDGLQPGRAVLQ